MILDESKYSQKEILEIIGTLEKYSDHPLGEAIVTKVKSLEDILGKLKVENFLNISGRGDYRKDR